MKTIVTKFGGSSLASTEQFRKVAAIIQADPNRRVVVASAPGKRSGADVKVTDLLYRCYEQAVSGGDYRPVLEQIRLRFAEIISGLGVSFDLDRELAVIDQHLQQNPEREYMASRGEYLNAGILAAFLGWTFCDTAELVRFSAEGVFDAEQTQTLLSTALQRTERAVLPGFYGASEDGTIHTFSRGGSDVTGALAARAAQAELYENWTDVSGMLAADPRIVENPRAIDYISYQELRELSYMGASVLHEDAVFPVRKAGIPINIRNTNRPEDPGTMIVAVLPESRRPRIITGIAGRTGFSSIQVEKPMMNAEIGFGAKLLQILASYGVPFEHCPTGIDTMSVLVNKEHLQPVRTQVLAEIQEKLQPEILTVEDNLALIAVVGQGMASARGTAARIFGKLADNGVNIRMIDQGSSELNIIIGVDEADYQMAVCSCYAAGVDDNQQNC